MTGRFTQEQMCALSDSALQKMNTQGRRGTSMVTYDEIEAMGCLITCLYRVLQKETSRDR